MIQQETRLAVADNSGANRFALYLELYLRGNPIDAKQKDDWVSKLKECGVFGVSSDEYLNYALENRREWLSKGEDAVKRMIEKYSKPEDDKEEEKPASGEPRMKRRSSIGSTK